MRHTLAIIATAILLVGCTNQPMADDPPPISTTPPSTQPSATTTPTRTTTPTSTPTPKATPLNPARDKAITEAQAAIAHYLKLLDKYAHNPDGKTLPQDISRTTLVREQQNYLLAMLALEDKGLHLISGETKVYFRELVDISSDYTEMLLRACIDSTDLKFNRPNNDSISLATEITWQTQKQERNWKVQQIDKKELKSCI